MDELSDVTQEPGTAGRPPCRVGLDSVLAIRDIRRRVVGALQDAATDRVPLREILALDPLTVLRLLRMARAPVNNITGEIGSIDALIQSLGSILVKRALEVRVAEVTGTEEVRILWMHALAVGHAAAALAEGSDSVESDAAYFQGILLHVTDWVRILSAPHELDAASSESLWRPGDWTPPVAALSTTDRRKIAFDATGATPIEDAQTLICKAELLADLAGFWHPNAGGTEEEAQLLARASKEDLVAAQNLRSRIRQVLSRTNLYGTGIAPRDLVLDPDENLTFFGWKREKSRLADVVTFLQHCNSTFRYRGIITATTAASLRFLDYERAFLAVWSPEGRCCWIRAKSDMSPRPLEPLQVFPDEHEVDIMQNCLEVDMAARIERVANVDNTILDALGVDELLCVPMNSSFKFPSLLLLDRTLTRRPVIEDDDLRAATALASTASILNENLLLKKVGLRSRRFALTDPLTRLYNRGVGLGTLEREISRATRTSAPLTVLMLDLDEFKNLNDSFGHLKGDSALRLCADVMRRTLRKQDTICRYGGEEFMVVLPETTIERASIIATRLFTAVESAGLEEGLPLTVSVGLTQVLTERDTVESVLTRADRALYASKSRGRNRFSIDSLK
jgi:diguanylate cyclase (GGDEF)-like protein